LSTRWRGAGKGGSGERGRGSAGAETFRKGGASIWGVIRPGNGPDSPPVR